MVNVDGGNLQIHPMFRHSHLVAAILNIWKSQDSTGSNLMIFERLRIMIGTSTERAFLLGELLVLLTRSHQLYITQSNTI